MKTLFSNSLAALFVFFCFMSCQNKLIGPYRSIEVAVITNRPYLDVALYTMPDSIKSFSGFYDMEYLREGTFHLSNIPDGEYWIIVKEEGKHQPFVGEKFKYTGKKSITLEL